MRYPVGNGETMAHFFKSGPLYRNVLLQRQENHQNVALASFHFIRLEVIIQVIQEK
jgi:hypothetical protein